MQLNWTFLVLFEFLSKSFAKPLTPIQINFLLLCTRIKQWILDIGWKYVVLNGIILIYLRILFSRSILFYTNRILLTEMPPPSFLYEFFHEDSIISFLNISIEIWILVYYLNLICFVHNTSKFLPDDKKIDIISFLLFFFLFTILIQKFINLLVRLTLFFNLFDSSRSRKRFYFSWGISRLTVRNLVFLLLLIINSFYFSCIVSRHTYLSILCILNKT